jgi:molybdopterin-guanine dinucleotide biosynthesis protein A
MQTLPIRISADASDTVTYALDSGQNAIHSLLETIDVALVRLTTEQAKHLLNVNTPDDFRRVSE